MEDGESSLFAPDCLTPSQWRDLHRGEDGPIKKLMLAVLERAVFDIIEPRPQTRRRKQKFEAQRISVAHERRSSAIDWISDTDADGVFSFQTVCAVLDIDPERLRSRLRERLAEKQAA